MTLRNRARALAALDRLKEAEDTFKKAVDADPTDDQSYLWYSSFLSEQERYEEAYELGEKAILADPEDGRLYMHLAIDILNNGFHRTSSGGIEGPAPRKTRPRFAVPLIVRAVGDFQPGIVQEAVRVLVRADAVFEAQAIAAGRAPEGRYDSAPLDSLVSLISAETGDAPRAGGPRV
jgi:tetratricopeptide (TPR) repeat protein